MEKIEDRTPTLVRFGQGYILVYPNKTALEYKIVYGYEDNRNILKNN